jgi:hypothetical protein
MLPCTPMPFSAPPRDNPIVLSRRDAKAQREGCPAHLPDPEGIPALSPGLSEVTASETFDPEGILAISPGLSIATPGETVPQPARS